MERPQDAGVAYGIQGVSSHIIHIVNYVALKFNTGHPCPSDPFLGQLGGLGFLILSQVTSFGPVLA